MIVGTAGHIDHGKTALVRALTGTDTDRLVEEKKRGISIDLGFAYRERADGRVMGFVDVPGHERFMRNMLAGASGIDLVLLVVAADDGVMPQTREHLAVVELLGITSGIVALSKCDLVDEARLETVEHDIRELLAPGPLAASVVHRVSAHTGEGIAQLWQALESAAVDGHSADGPPRFAVDRCFSLRGLGTVVTGVMLSGHVAAGDTLVISPAGRPARVRSIHVNNRSVMEARAGERCGINLAGIEESAVGRGDALLSPGLHAPTARIDCELRLLSDTAHSLRQWRSVRFHHAASETRARVALLQDDPFTPGQRGLVQLVLGEPIAAAIGDRFVLREGDGSGTIGGGRIVDLRPPQRRRKQPQRLAQIAAMALDGPACALAAQLKLWPFFVEWPIFVRDRAIGLGEVERLLHEVPHRRAGDFLFGPAIWDQLEKSAIDYVQGFHARYPQLLGPNRQRLAGALEPALPRVAGEAMLGELVELGKLAQEGGVCRLPNHRLGLDHADEALWRTLAPLIGGEKRFRPPRIGELAVASRQRELDVRRVLKAMARQGKTVQIAVDYFVLQQTMEEVAGIVCALALESPDGLFGAAQLRDRLANGRKVAIWMLEYLDRTGLTARRGDQRIIAKGRL